MEKIKILYTINYLTNGGPSKVLLNQIYSLNKDKYEITVLTIIDSNDKEIIRKLKNNKINIVELKIDKTLSGLLKNYNEVIDKINEINPDIVHTHGVVTSYIVSSSKIKCKKITTIHNNMYGDYKYSYGKIKGKIIEILHIHYLKKFDSVVCCSETSYTYLCGKINNASYVRNGVDTKHNNKEIREKIRNELGINDNDVVFVYGGAISKLKRVYELINLFEKYNKPNQYLLIVGDGPLLNKCKEISNKNIIFTGFKENIIDYFDASDIYVSNSSSEGFSISLIEALSSGLLCLLSNIPSHKECLSIDKNTYIGETFNENNFEEKLKKIIKNLNSESKKEIKLFQKKYLSSEVMAKEYEKKYSDLVVK